MKTAKELADRFTPQNIKDLKGYVPGKSIEEVLRDYKPARIAKLASNENRLGCSPAALKAASESFKVINNYPDSLSVELRQKIADENGVSANNVICGGGSDAIIHQITRTFFHDGDEAITVNATFLGFFIASKIRNMTIKFANLNNDYEYNLDAVLAQITENTKVIYLANPNNPTGTYFTAPEFERFMAEVPDDVLVILDEAYIEFARGIAPEYPDTLSYNYPNVIVLRTFSKAYGLAGFRVGYAIAAEEWIEPLLKTKLTFDPTGPSQAAAIAALDDKDFLEKTITAVTKGRQELYNIFESCNLRYIKSYANSVMLHYDSEEEAIHATEELLKRGVIVRRLPGFGLPNCVRISTGLKKDHEQLKQALQEIYK